MKKTNYTLGLAIAAAGALLCIIGTLLIFTRWYDPILAAQRDWGRPDEEAIVRWVFPALSDIGVTAGVLWAVAAFGFGTRKSWAWSLGIIANVLALQGSFFPMIPPLTRDLPPASGIVFLPNLIFFVLMLLVVRRLDWRILVLSLFTGIAMVLSFMNGVAGIDKILITDNPVFVAVQRLNWFAALGWGVFTASLILKRSPWVRPLGLGAALMGITAGFPLSIITAAEAGRFSMFLPAPLLSLALLVVLLLPIGEHLASASAPATS